MGKISIVAIRVYLCPLSGLLTSVREVVNF